MVIEKCRSKPEFLYDLNKNNCFVEANARKMYAFSISFKTQTVSEEKIL